jgi:hypothetical protein
MHPYRRISLGGTSDLPIFYSSNNPAQPKAILSSRYSAMSGRGVKTIALRSQNGRLRERLVNVFAKEQTLMNTRFDSAGQEQKHIIFAPLCV